MQAQRKLPKVPAYPAEKARGGDIILRTPFRRAIFMAGLVGALILALTFILFVKQSQAANGQAPLGGWATVAMTIFGPLLLAFGLLYGTIQWRRRKWSRSFERERNKKIREQLRE